MAARGWPVGTQPGSGSVGWRRFVFDLLEREKTSARSVEIESKSDLSSKNSPRLADCIWQPESQSQIEIHKKLDYSANKREGSKNVDGILKC